jgi:hypothetical protein
MVAITLPKGLSQLGVFFASLGVKPLFKLVQDDEYLLPLDVAQGGNGAGQIQVARQFGTPHPQAFEQPGLGIASSGFDINRGDLAR